MKLLLDENLSPKLAVSLGQLYPGSRHVEDCQLGAASDDQIWEFARREGLVIVSKDSDFYDRAVVYGSPPKVLWVRAGNCSTGAIEGLLRRFESIIKAFGSRAETTTLVVSASGPSAVPVK